MIGNGRRRGYWLVTPAAAARFLLATCFLVLLFNGGARFAIGLLLQPMTEDLGWSRSEVSLNVTLFMVLTAGAMFLVGRLVDQVGTAAVLGAVMLVSAVGLISMGFIEHPWQALLLYGVVFALGSADRDLFPAEDPALRRPAGQPGTRRHCRRGSAFRRDLLGHRAAHRGLRLRDRCVVSAWRGDGVHHHGPPLGGRSRRACGRLGLRRLRLLRQGVRPHAGPVRHRPRPHPRPRPAAPAGAQADGRGNLKSLARRPHVRMRDTTQISFAASMEYAS